MPRHVSFALLLSALWAQACFTPNYGEGGFLCQHGECPEGYICVSESGTKVCRKEAVSARPDGGSPDAGADAGVDGSAPVLCAPGEVEVAKYSAPVDAFDLVLDHLGVPHLVYLEKGGARILHARSSAMKWEVLEAATNSKSAMVGVAATIHKLKNLPDADSYRLLLLTTVSSKLHASHIDLDVAGAKWAAPGQVADVDGLGAISRFDLGSASGNPRLVFAGLDADGPFVKVAGMARSVLPGYDYGLTLTSDNLIGSDLPVDVVSAVRASVVPQYLAFIAAGTTDGNTAHLVSRVDMTEPVPYTLNNPLWLIDASSAAVAAESGQGRVHMAFHKAGSLSYQRWDPPDDLPDAQSWNQNNGLVEGSVDIALLRGTDPCITYRQSSPLPGVYWVRKSGGGWRAEDRVAADNNVAKATRVVAAQGVAYIAYEKCDASGATCSLMLACREDRLEP